MDLFVISFGYVLSFLSGYMTDKQSNICNCTYVSLSSNTMRATIMETLYIWLCEQLTRNRNVRQSEKPVTNHMHRPNISGSGLTSVIDDENDRKCQTNRQYDV